jgi:hypothetical protein
MSIPLASSDGCLGAFNITAGETPRPNSARSLVIATPNASENRPASARPLLLVKTTVPRPRHKDQKTLALHSPLPQPSRPAIALSLARNSSPSFSILYVAPSVKNGTAPRTCRALSAPTVDALWMHLDSLDPIIKVFPRRMWANLLLCIPRMLTTHSFRGPCSRVSATVQHNVIAALAETRKHRFPCFRTSQCSYGANSRCPT